MPALLISTFSAGNSSDSSAANADGGGIFDIERERLHARVGGNGLVKRGVAASGDDDAVAECVEGLSEAAANAGAAACDQDCITGDSHTHVSMRGADSGTPESEGDDTVRA